MERSVSRAASHASLCSPTQPASAASGVSRSLSYLVVGNAGKAGSKVTKAAKELNGTGLDPTQRKKLEAAARAAVNLAVFHDHDEPALVPEYIEISEGVTVHQ